MKGNLKQLLTVALVLFASVFASAQVKTYTGTVVSPDGQPLPGVNVKVAGTAKGTSADFDGNFTIAAEKGQKLEISFVGYKQQTVVLADKVSLSITLEEDASVLDDVVIVAYGTAKKKDLTGAITTVTSKDIENRQVSTVTRALEGQVSGLQVTSSTGQPGTDATIRIRGIGSLNASSTALILLDGVPYPSTLSTINPDDIESVTVLKDAASTSLYGARAANGIVAVTTKKGKKNEKAQISFQARLGWNEKALPQYDKITDAAEYYELTWMALKNYYFDNTGNYGIQAGTFASSNLFAVATYNAFKMPEGAEYLIDPTTGKIVEGATQLYTSNWANELYTKNFRQDYNVSVKGGGEKTAYFMSLGYLSDPSYVVNSSFKRFSSRFSLDSQVNNWLKIGASFAYSRRDTSDPPYGGEASSNSIFYYADYMAPLYPMYALNADGTIKYDNDGNKIYDLGSGQTDKAIYKKNRPFFAGYNPMTFMTLDKFQSLYDNLSGNAYGEVKFLSDFTFKATLSLDQVFGNLTTFQNNQWGIGARPDINGFLAKEKTQNTVLNANQTLTWSHEYGNHHVDVLAGHEYYWTKYSYQSASMINMLIPGIAEFSNFITPDGNPTSYTNGTSMESYFAQAQYNYNNKYYFQASVRMDGSSKFKYNKWGTFYAFGASWRMAEEEWLKNAQWINELKVRGSYGTTGNQAVNSSNYPYTDLWNVSDNNGQFAVSQAQIGNPELTWETVTSLDFGVDFRFWNKFHGSIDWYRRVTHDLIYSVAQAASTGRTSRLENDGKLANQGIELDLNYDVFNSNKLFWSVNLNGAFSKMKLLALPDYLMEQAEGVGYVNGSYLWKIGKDIYNIYYGEGAGIDPETGYKLYWKDKKDADGNVIGREKTANYNEQTKYEQGSSLPDFIGGFNTTFRYAGFDLSIATNFQFGGWVNDANYLNGMFYGFLGGKTLNRDLLYNSWTPENTDATLPMFTYGTDTDPGQDFKQNFVSASYFNLKNVTIGYTLPKTVTNKLLMSSLRVYASGENLWFVSARQGFDPRTGISAGSTFAAYAQMRTITFGLNVNF
ncbi:MAG: TonB-dependent receptor [Flavobacteriales bacterium]|nr:TonB-dependent receptor [Flavobacteriales bacterium]